jgi:hypothetical protein
MLTAFNAAGDNLAYETVADFRAGHLIQAERSWSWPAVPSPGQLQYVRDAFSATPRGASETTAPVKLTEDDGYTTVVPHPSRYLQKEHARLIVVCYAGTGQTGCGWERFNTPAGTWSQHTAVMPYIDYTPSPRGADLARQIAHGQWRIVGRTRLRGQRAIKLAQTRSGTFQGHPVFLWVSTAAAADDLGSRKGHRGRQLVLPAAQHAQPRAPARTDPARLPTLGLIPADASPANHRLGIRREPADRRGLLPGRLMIPAQRTP